MKRSEFVQECTKSWPHYPDTPSMRKFFNVIADAIGLKDDTCHDVTESEAEAWAEVGSRCGTFQEIGGSSPGGHMVSVEHNGGMYEVFLNGCSVLVFSVPSEAVEFAGELRNALSRAPASDAENRAEAAETHIKELVSETDQLAKDRYAEYRRAEVAESRIKELESELAKRPAHQVEALAAGPDASKELEELREKVKKLESKLPKIEVMRRASGPTVMINGNPYRNFSSELSALENCKLLRRFLGLE